ncbi:flagellin [Saccharospirillum impatiens]|uniref:flagellin N-terminal helical domain-containing protein n=1 Tax=Saccharospirillum impatiens TaxID=169438 RepID=UPI0003F5B2BC|nr:flagellin [Saccharospirillum impatiens]
MAQIINTNIASLNAQRNLNNSQSANSTALERLSSGLRINSAKDDAAGLAISTKFESQTRGLNQAIRNAGDGISLAQTAEGALGSMTDNLQRVRELAVQSANATNSDEDRVALQQEVSALVAEITRTADETNFNGRNLFDGDFNGTFQIGANAGQTVDVSIGELTAGRLGSSDQVGVSAIGTDEAIGNGDLIINGVAINASKAEDDTASTDNSAASAIAKVESINRQSDETGVTAFVNENTAAGSEMTGANLNGSITLNGVTIDIATSTDTDSSRASVTQAINAYTEQTGVMAVDTGSNSNGVQLVAEDGRNIQIAFDTVTAGATGLAAADTYEGGFTLVANGETKEIVVEGGNGTGNGDLSNSGLSAGTFSRAVAASVSESLAESQAATTIGGGTFANTIDATATTVTTNETSVSVNVGGTVTDSVLATGSNVADLAAAVDGVAGVTAWEEVALSLTASTLVTGDTLTLTTGSGASVVTASEDTDLQTLADDINGTDFSASEIDVVAEFDGTNISLTIRNYSGSEVAFAASANDVTSGAGALDGNVAIGELAFTSTDGEDIEVNLADPVTGGELFAGNNASAEYTGVDGLDNGDLVINGVTIGAAKTIADTASSTKASDGTNILSSSKERSALSIAASINDVSGETGVTAIVESTTVVGGDGTNVGDLDGTGDFEVGDEGGIYINGVNIGAVTLQADGNGDIDTDRARADALNLINQNSGKTGVSAIDNGESLTLTAADGRNVSVAIDDKAGSDASIGAMFGLDAAEDGIGESTFGEEAGSTAVGAEGLAYETTYGTIRLESAGTFTVAGGSNGNDEVEALGLRTGTFGGGEDGQFLKDVDISTFEGAQSAITAIDNALQTVASQRAELGALQNRFESTVSNLAITAENLTAANSRIRDADFAAETAELSRTQVLQQAGISILAQANQRPQQVLSLLG